MESCCRSQRRYSPAMQWAAVTVQVAVASVAVRKSRVQPWKVPCCSQAIMSVFRAGHLLLSLASDVPESVNFTENARSGPVVCLHSRSDEAPPAVPVLQFAPQL